MGHEVDDMTDKFTGENGVTHVGEIEHYIRALRIATPVVLAGDDGEYLLDPSYKLLPADVEKETGRVLRYGSLPKGKCAGVIQVVVLAEKKEKKQTRIEDLNRTGRRLHWKTRQMLIRNGITTVGELVQKTPSDLLRIRGFGEGTLGNVRRLLQKVFNLYLKGV